MRTLVIAGVIAISLCTVASFAWADEQEDANLALAHQLADNFAKGDMNAVADMFADDVEMIQWGSEDIIPLHGERHGKEAAMQWFADVDAAFKADDFGLDEYYADGDTVVVLGHQAGVAPATGMRFSEHFVGFITFNAGGKITRFRGMDDSGQEMRVLGLFP